jgi:hypothetical protein
MKGLYPCRRDMKEINPNIARLVVQKDESKGP